MARNGYADGLENITGQSDVDCIRPCWQPGMRRTQHTVVEFPHMAAASRENTSSAPGGAEHVVGLRTVEAFAAQMLEKEHSGLGLCCNQGGEVNLLIFYIWSDAVVRGPVIYCGAFPQYGHRTQHPVGRSREKFFHERKQAVAQTVAGKIIRSV